MLNESSRRKCVLCEFELEKDREWSKSDHFPFMMCITIGSRNALHMTVKYGESEFDITASPFVLMPFDMNMMKE